MDERGLQPTPSQRHLSLDELGDLDAGLLSPDEDAAARAHVAGCTACSADLTALAGVSSLLAAAAVVPMPADVAVRIEAALADEARQRAVGGASVVSASDSATVGSRPSARPTSSAIGDLDAVRARRERSGRVRRGAAALVGVAAVLGGGYLFGDTLLSAVDLSPSGSDDSADSSAESAADTEGGAGAPAASASGTAYTSATLSSDVSRLLEQPNAPVAPVPSSARGLDDDGADGVADTSRCVDAVAARADGSASPLAVDVGTFDGVPAVVVVLAAPPTSDDVAQVWVVSDACLLPESTGLEVLDRVTLSDLPAPE